MMKSDELQSSTVAQLKEACRASKLTVSGKKSDLLERLKQHYAEGAVEGENGEVRAKRRGTSTKAEASTKAEMKTAKAESPAVKNTAKAKPDGKNAAKDSQKKGKKRKASGEPKPLPEKTLAQKDKARRIQEYLNEMYPNPPVPLNHNDNFTLLVAVCLSAQTTDGKVNEVRPGGELLHGCFARAL